MTEIKTRKPRKPKAAPPESSDLLAALQWVKVAQSIKLNAAPYEMHSVIENGWLTAFDGTLAAGHRVKLDLSATVRTDRLLSALEKAGTGLSITFDERLTVAGSRLRAAIPTLPQGVVVAPVPDGRDDAPACLDALLAGMKKLLPLVKEGASTVLESSMLMQAGTITATNRMMVLQFWHGLDIPTFVLPRSACSALAKLDGLTQIAWSETTVTFWFGEDKWLRTQVYAEPWPDVSRILDIQSSPLPIPTGMIEAVEAVAAQSDDDNVYLNPLGGIWTKDREAQAIVATGARERYGVNSALLLLMLSLATEADFALESRIAFFGENLRGVLATVEPY